MTRTANVDPRDLFETANSYFGLLRQSPQSHTDRAHLANLLRRKGRTIDKQFTKTFRRTP